MFDWFTRVLQRLFGSANERIIKSFDKTVEAINALEPELEALSDDALRARTDAFRARLEEGETLDDLLVEAFATVREAAKRTLGQRHFDVQLMGGIVLHRGQIAEMKTGEGKTLVATLPVYLNALAGEGVHIVTVNDYLAGRDAEWMGQIYEFLGMSVGCIVRGPSHDERQAQYACDITYGTNNEFGFDYLRDNMAHSLAQMVQRPFNFVIVDEVDSILIDESRMPLIISGALEDSSELYRSIDKLIPKLDAADFEKDEKAKAVTLTEEGAEKVEQLLREAGLLESDNLYDIQNVSVVHYVNQALKAHQLFALDTDYIIKDDKVVLIDEFTGRMMEGRRFSEGLHQALEAKEGVEIQSETQTLASITYQNYFRLYPKIAGMTGTAVTEAAEFEDIYSLDVVEVPTNLPCVREDFDDEVYRTAQEKYEAVVALVDDCRRRGQPLLVGTVSIEKSEELAKMLKKRKIPHNVLNARYHEQEAQIIGQAGKSGGVTIATNMAGRGTDIQLGGNFDMRIRQELDGVESEAERRRLTDKIRSEIEADRHKVVEAGGVYIVGTERHESRRIDNQLRGRSGRQGDPGTSKFFLSLEDDLMRIFGSDRMDGMLQKLGLEEGEAIIHPWINKAIEKAQSKVEAQHFEARKHTLKYDDVMSDQRRVIYEQRIGLMSGDDVADDVAEMRHGLIDDMVERFIPEKSYAEQWETGALHEEARRLLNLDVPVDEWAKEEGIAGDEIRERLLEKSDELMADKDARYTPDVMRAIEKDFLLQHLDRKWIEHITTLEHLRRGIQLVAIGQRRPLDEYKREAFNLFETMLDRLRESITAFLTHVEIRFPEREETRAPPPLPREGRRGPVNGEDPSPMPPFPGAGLSARVAPDARIPDNPATWGKVGRNEPCPCGSGNKYKRCHGRVS